MLEAFVSMTCPSCFEIIEVAAPGEGELPAEWDCDCEICCRPMVIEFADIDGEIVAETRGISE